MFKASGVKFNPETESLQDSAYQGISHYHHNSYVPKKKPKNGELSTPSCASRSRCTRAKKEPRGLTIRTQDEHIALQKRREIQNTPEFLKTYNKRAGIEGSISQGVRRSALRQSRYIGLAKTHLQHILIAAGLNLCRLYDWLNDVPLAASRYSRFMSLKPKTS